LKHTPINQFASCEAVPAGDKPDKVDLQPHSPSVLRTYWLSLQEGSAVAVTRTELCVAVAFILVLAALEATFLLAARYLSVEADEAWILMSTSHAFHVRLPPTAAIDLPTITTGGLHFLVQGLLSRITMASARAVCPPLANSASVHVSLGNFSRATS